MWWARFAPPVGVRPVLLLTRDRALAVRSVVTVARVTTTIRGLPFEVALGPEDGLPKRCVANLDVIDTVPKQALIERICDLSSLKMNDVRKALLYALDLE